ncbi:MAG: glycogen debranching enzyme [Clostridiales bacterium]|nr:glycogen debranching enzyme [Clostridiales bacterium]
MYKQRSGKQWGNGNGIYSGGVNRFAVQSHIGETSERKDEASLDAGNDVPASDDEKIGSGLLALDRIDGFDIRPGFYRMNGAYQSGNGVSFTINSHGATSCTLLLYHADEQEPFARIKIPEAYRLGDAYSVLVFNLPIEDLEYAYQFEGPKDPARGLLFDPKNVILDPYAQAVTGQKNWGEKDEGDVPFVYHARVVKSTFDWNKQKQLEHPFEDLIIYETHVRGFTKDESSGVVGGGTFEGLRQKIPYLKDLGINAVELMPIFEFDEMESARVVDGVQLYNYWGYNTVSFFAPNTSYAYADKHNQEGDELKHLIRELKENGIEVILDVVFNHTAEGNENGPCFSFKGLDNNIYYMLTPDGYYYNFSGCGNVLNCNNAVVRRFILDCLRHWAIDYRVDGFRFDLASILGRDQNGAPMEHPPILEMIAFDPILSRMKLIAEAWDAGGLYQVGNFPSWGRWAEWNGRYRDDMRQFLKGDPDTAGRAIARITGSEDIYDPKKRGYSASVNFLTCHDGFTLYDLYSYNTKHNEKNGWDNTDGDNNGNSWNCGCEGETDDVGINGLRCRLVKNAFAALMCSRGPAMFLAGDEFCNTQFGNNNAYCQDNIISWLDWTRLEKYKEVHDFARLMIHFRKHHPILRKNTKQAECGLPSISIHNGEPYKSSTDYNTHLIGIMYAGRNRKDTDDDIIFYAMNAYWESLVIRLPEAPRGWHWKVVVNTYLVYRDGTDYTELTDSPGWNQYIIRSRSTLIFQAERDKAENPGNNFEQPGEAPLNDELLALIKEVEESVSAESEDADKKIVDKVDGL